MRKGTLFALISTCGLALCGGCVRQSLREMGDGTQHLVKGDYAGAASPFAKAASRSTEKALAIEDHGIALAWSGHVDEGTAEIQRAANLFPQDDRLDEEQSLYALGRAWQTTRDCEKTKAGYAPYIAYASRFPDQAQDVAFARQDVAIICKEPGAFGNPQQPAGPASESAPPAAPPASSP